MPVDSLAYAYCEAEEHNFANLFIEKMVVFGKPSGDGKMVVATVYLRGREKGKHTLTTCQEAESLIKEVSLTSLCCGCGIKPASGKHISYRDMIFSAKCLLSMKTDGQYVLSASTRESWLKTKRAEKGKGRVQAIPMKKNSAKTFLEIYQEPKKDWRMQ